MLTKQAHDYLTKQAMDLPGVLRGIGKGVYRAGQKGYDAASWLVRKPGAGLYRNVAKPVAHAGLKATGAVGNFVYKHPTVGLPLLAAGLYGGYKAPDNLRKNLLHSDPQTGFTEYRNSPLFGIPASPLIGPTTKIDYHSAQAARAARNYPVYY